MSQRVMVVAWLLLGLSLPQFVLAAEPKKVALLVGVNEYQRRNFSSLRYAERDMSDLEAELKKLGFTTTLLKGNADGASRATRTNIEKALQQLVADTGKEDIVLVALAGHGVQFGTQPTGGGKKDEAYFCPYDATFGDVNTLLSLSYVIDDVLGTKGGRNLLLVDACRNEPTVSTRGVQGARVALPANTAVLFACSSGQTSVESAKIGGGHGVFTYCILEALRGKAARDGEVSWADLVATVETLMESAPEVKRVLDDAPPQTPIHAGNVRRTVLGRLKQPPQLLIAPFDTKAARSKQEEWAAYLGLHDPVIQNSIGMKLALIPPGKFTRGSQDDRANAKSVSLDEKPQPAEVESPLFVGVSEVSQTEFERVMGNNPSYFQANGAGKDHVKGMDTAPFPVEQVAYYAAAEFCNRLSRSEKLPAYYTIPAWSPAEKDSAEGKTPPMREPLVVKGGRGYRLLSDTQWEYACRAGTTTPFHFGNTSNGTESNIVGQYAPYGGAKPGPQLDRTSQIGSYPGNAFGLFDMHGNVAEWIELDHPRAAIWLRGGSYGNVAELTRSAARSRAIGGAFATQLADDLAIEFEGIGFRVARDP